LPRFERALNHSTVWSVGVARRPVLASGDDHRISPDCIYMRHHEASTVYSIGIPSLAHQEAENPHLHIEVLGILSLAGLAGLASIGS